jgi:hypothetical protein
MLNLFIGIIVDTIQTTHEAGQEAKREQLEGAMLQDTDRVLVERQDMRHEPGRSADERRGVGAGDSATAAVSELSRMQPDQPGLE